jgi:hypothetical protein
VAVLRRYEKEDHDGREDTSALGYHDLPNASIVLVKAHGWIRRTILKEENLEDQVPTASGDGCS